MAEYFKGTLLASPVVRGSSGDTYGTHHSVLGVGGFMEVKTIAERNNLPVDDVNKIGYDDISSGQRRIGMLVYVHEEDKIYQLKIDKTTWDGLDVDGKMNALADNANWVVFVGGDASGELISKEFTQTNHQFVVGDVIGHDGNQFVKVDVTTAETIEPLGVVGKVIDLNTFILIYSGYIDTSSILDSDGNNLSGGTVYYLSDVVGKITSIEPTDVGVISKPVLVVMQTGEGIVLQYRSFKIKSDDGVDWDTFTGYTATTQQQLDNTITGGTNLGSFEGKTGVQILPIIDLDQSNGVDYSGDYKSVYNYYYRDSDGVIQIGIPDDGIPRRGYVKEDEPKYSWIWDEYLLDSNSTTPGWIIVEGDVTSPDVYGQQYINNILNSYLPYYTNDFWVQNQSYNNGSNIVIGSVLGNLTSGDTYTDQGPLLSEIEDGELKLRTIISDTPDVISVTYDDYFIRLSGKTSSVVDAINIGNGAKVYSGTSDGGVLQFRTLKGGGDTSVTENGDVITITTYSSGGGGGAGSNVTLRITQVAHGFNIGDVVGISGDSYTKAIADGSYDGEVIGIVSNVINDDVFELTQSGYLTGLTGLITGETYYVSTVSAGDMVVDKPTNIGDFVRPIFAAKTSTIGWVLPYQGYYIEAPSGGGGNEYYTGKTPSTIDLGGISAGTILTGKTYTELFQELLVPTLSPTLTPPYNSMSKNPTTTYYEIDENVNISFTSIFNRGQITLDGTFQNYRAGLPNTHCFTGPSVNVSIASTNLSENTDLNSYSVVQGVQTWSSCVDYDAGPQPLDSDGNPYDSPLPAGSTGFKNVNIEGVYPLYATCVTITNVDALDLVSMISANNVEITLVPEITPDKQKFDVPDVWLSSRSLKGVCQFNTASNNWEYPGGSQQASLNIWSSSSTSHSVQGNNINYTRYTYNSTDRGSVKIRLVF